MVEFILAGVAVAGLGYYLFNKYGSPAKVAAVKAEIANLEALAKADASKVSAEVQAIIAKIKAAL